MTDNRYPIERIIDWAYERLKRHYSMDGAVKDFDEDMNWGRILITADDGGKLLEVVIFEGTNNNIILGGWKPATKPWIKSSELYDDINIALDRLKENLGDDETIMKLDIGRLRKLEVDFLVDEAGAYMDSYGHEHSTEELELGIVYNVAGVTPYGISQVSVDEFIDLVANDLVWDIVNAVLPDEWKNGVKEINELAEDSYREFL
ncbi:MAG: hypothetical protein GXO43_02295 [Crenarchaeota archaeon]|nr:hypothetical protein [Thermoproteota archaeon]